MTDQTTSTSSPEPTTVEQLEATVAELAVERERLTAQRRRTLVFVVVSVSLLIHIGMMYYLNNWYRYRPAGAGSDPMIVEFAILNENELTQLEAVDFDDISPESIDDMDELPMDDGGADLEATVSSADVELSNTGAAPVLGGVGSGESGARSLDGAGSGTSFFGVSSKGTRFAYIVDISGSMREGRKLAVAMRELGRSIASLPDYAQLFVMLFSTGFVEPPMQDGWMRARRTVVAAVTRWLNSIDPGGGTLPLQSFARAFSLETRPDVIFFLTDGEIPSGTADEVARMNRRGSRVVINTIAFGNPSSQEQLKQIANDAGGMYRYVPASN